MGVVYDIKEEKKRNERRANTVIKFYEVDIFLVKIRSI